MASFLLDPGVIFLNHGSFGATPVEILAVQQDLRQRMEREPVDFLVRQLPGLLAAARERAARFVGARPQDLVFVPNATAGVGAVLRSLALRPGDELLTTNHRYNAVFQAMRREAGRAGARVLEARIPWPVQDPAALSQAVLAGIGPRTRLLVVDQITSPTGLILPVEDIVAGARARGVAVLVDGAHAPGQVELDLARLGADWWVGNLHKWVCAPKGAALLWTAPEHQGQARPPVTSHGADLGYHPEFDWPGTFDPTAWLAAPAAMDLHEAEGGPALRAAHHALVQAGRLLLSEALARPLPHPDDPRFYGSMAAISVGLPASQALALHTALWTQHRIEVPVSPFEDEAVLRISGFALYNRPEDYEALAAVLPGCVAALQVRG